VGIDPDPLETSAAKQYGFYRRIHTCGGAAIPEADATFDFVFSNSVLEHIPDLEPVIAEVGRVLKPGGRFFFTVPCPGFHENLAGSLSGKARTDYLAEIDRRLAHFHYLSELDWEQMCKRCGLVLQSADGYVTQGETRRWETLSRFTGGLLHKLSRGKSRPIEIQRALKLRSLQNRAPLPRPIAAGIARAIASGVDHEACGAPSCLLLTGRR
jgi:SAM-dependent methyltransferase